MYLCFVQTFPKATQCPEWLSLSLPEFRGDTQILCAVYKLLREEDV